VKTGGKFVGLNLFTAITVQRMLIRAAHRLILIAINCAIKIINRD